MEQWLTRVGGAVWGWPTMVLFLSVGLLFTVRLRGIQLRRLGTALRLVFSDGEGGGISPYAALCTALAATIGTGNIVGVATALAAGGPGALFWMLLSAVFGMATQYAEGFLAVKYRSRNKNGRYGGPFCYIEQGLGVRFRPLAKLFAAIGAAVGILGVGTVTQVNSITAAADGFFGGAGAVTLFGRSYSAATVISGVLVTLGAAAVLLGGARRISKVCETLVPLMSAVYVVCSVLVLARFADRIPSAVSLIVRSAFAPRAVLGGAAGISVKTVLRMGIGRGVFTNEAGVGSTPIAAAASSCNDPVKQGLITMTGTFIDTLVICTLTGLCLVVTDAWQMPFEGGAITDHAWRVALPWGQDLSSFLLMVCLVLFGFATILGWNFYAESCLTYLVGENRRLRLLYRLGYLGAIAVGPFLSVTAAWEAADILNALMALPNLAALLLLQNTVVRETKKSDIM